MQTACFFQIRVVFGVFANSLCLICAGLGIYISGRRPAMALQESSLMVWMCRYLDSKEDLIRLAASLHLLPAKPDAIMIDDIGSFRA